MAKVEVLCPNGRRVSVKVTPNTKILQILEESCSKQGFMPASDFELKHGRRSLDVTLSVQFAALPNLAKLELVRMSKSRAESSVVLALQNADGTRVQGEFMPSETLWNILENLGASLGAPQKFTSCPSLSEHPVCIYMKDEVIGEYALRQTTLRDLGLTGGRVVIRHVFREVTDEMLAEIIHRVDTEKVRQTKLLSKKFTAESPVSSSQPTSVIEEHRLTPPSSTANNTSGSSSTTPMESDVELANSVTAGWNASRLTSIFQEPVYPEPTFTVDHSSSMHAASWIPAPFAEFKFPEETKGKHVYQNELSDTNLLEFKPCERETVVYSLDEVLPELNLEVDIPDEFFEVTESDVRRMWQDLQRRTTEMAEQPLLTQGVRHQQLESKMSRYKRVVIRIQFPDRLVIQGVFRTTETVFSVYKFVKEHLQDNSTEFDLYTTPPKLVLKDMTQNLVEANLAPMSLIYFGSLLRRDHFLSDKVISEVSSQQAANRVLVSFMPETPSASACSSATHAMAGAAAGPSSTRRPASTLPSSSAQSDHLPKWFKTGKK